MRPSTFGYVAAALSIMMASSACSPDASGTGSAGGRLPGAGGKADDPSAERAVCHAVSWYQPFEYARTPLMNAIDSVAHVESVLATGADPNEITVDGRTVLHQVARYGGEAAADIVRVLTAHGARVDVQDKNGSTPLIEAAWQKKPAVVRALLDAGADVTLRMVTGDTALTTVASNFWTLSSAETMLALIDAGSPLDVAGVQDGRTALLEVTALALSHPDVRPVVEALLEKGASPNQADCTGRTALANAAAANDDVLVKVLLDYGADPTRRADNGTTALSAAAYFIGWQPLATAALVDYPGIHFDPGDAGTEAALVQLANWARVAEVRLLLEAGVDANTPNAQGSNGGAAEQWTPVLALSVPCGWPIVPRVDADVDSVLDLLVAHGADLNAPQGRPLANVALRQDLPMLRKLLARGANPNTPDAAGRTALFDALRSDDLEDDYDAVINTLMDAGADPNVRAQEGITVLINMALSPFVGGGVPGMPPTGAWRPGFDRVLKAVSDDTLFARVGGRNAIHFALLEWGRDYNYAGAAVRPAENIAAEMRYRMQGKTSICDCEAVLAGVGAYEETDPGFPSCTLTENRARAHFSMGMSFVDSLCWPEAAP